MYFLLSDVIFPAAFADPILSESFMNHLAPAIGLLKREDGRHPPNNLHGVLRGLTLMASKRWFPAVHRHAFAFLIKRLVTFQLYFSLSILRIVSVGTIQQLQQQCFSHI